MTEPKPPVKRGRGRPPGGKKYGGRKKGDASAITTTAIDFHKQKMKEIIEEMKEEGLHTPAEFLLSVMWDEEQPTPIRIQAAQYVAKYFHPQAPTQVDVNTDGEVRIVANLNVIKPSNVERLIEHDSDSELVEADVVPLINTQVVR